MNVYNQINSRSKPSLYTCQDITCSFVTKLLYIPIEI